MQTINGNPTLLIIIAAVMLTVLGGVSLLAHIYNLNNIKSKTVGDGQHGTARWANKSEIRKIYRHIPFTPERWREQAAKGKEPTMLDGKPLPQGIVVGCTGSKGTTAMVDTGDVHALMIGAAGVGKTAFWLYPCIEYIKLPHTFRCDKCGNRGKYTDETFFPIVNGIINSIIAHPEILNSYNEINLSTDVVRTQNEINRAIDSGEYSDEFGEEIMNFISSLYECIDSNTYLTEKIKRIVSEMECINEFNKELFEQIVKNIIIKNDGDIEINLINNQILGKEIIEYGRNSETKCSLHTGNNKACDGPRYERQGVESGSLLSCIDQNGRTA